MKRITKAEADQMVKRPDGRLTYARGLLITMKVGEVILLERKDWTRKWQVPSTFCKWLGRETTGAWKCETLMDGTGWVIERLK